MSVPYDREARPADREIRADVLAVIGYYGPVNKLSVKHAASRWMGVSLHYEDVADAIDALMGLDLVDEQGSLGTKEYDLTEAGWERLGKIQ